MGCSVSAAVLQSSLISILQQYYFRGVIIYVDDILLYTDGTREHHMAFVKKILCILQQADARLKVSKVNLACKELRFLGMSVGGKDGRLLIPLLIG